MFSSKSGLAGFILALTMFSPLVATAICQLATSEVNFSDTLSQDDTLTISTDTFTESGRVTAPPGQYKLTITATTISGAHAPLTTPFEVTSSQ